MRRRDFITLLGGVAATWPLAARAQQPAMPVVGFLRNTSRDESAFLVSAVRNGLNETGYVEGQNVAIEYRWAESQRDQLPSLADDLVNRKVAVIIAGGNDAVRAALAATVTIPIVFSTGEDPVRLKFVTSLNRPGSNMTGVSFFSGSALAGKRLELSRELTPKLAKVAFFMKPDSPNAELETREVQTASRSLGLQLLVVRVSSDRDLDAAFANVIQQGVGAFLLAGDALFLSRRDRIGSPTCAYSRSKRSSRSRTHPCPIRSWNG